MEDLAPALVLGVLLAFVAFGQWLRQQRRVMIHRERLAAIEKGVELPPLEQEVERVRWNVQRILLLAGLIWISVGVAFFVVFSTMLSHPSPATADVPYGLQWAGLGMVGIGLSHLVAYAAGRSADR